MTEQPYDRSGWLPNGTKIVVNVSAPERILTAQEWERLRSGDDRRL